MGHRHGVALWKAKNFRMLSISNGLRRAKSGRALVAKIVRWHRSGLLCLRYKALFCCDAALHEAIFTDF
jgi:hypothetical protein